jgi:hypothetical protein
MLLHLSTTGKEFLLFMTEALVVPISEPNTDHFDVVYTVMPVQISVPQLPADRPHYLVLDVK